MSDDKTRERRFGEDTPFGAWLRGHPELRSRDGYDIENLDYILHHFLGGNLMLLEEKRNYGRQSYAQQDTHSLIHQALMCVCSLPSFSFKRMNSRRPTKITYWGYYVICFEHDNPEDGGIRINGIPVTKDELLLFLKFDQGFHKEFKRRVNEYDPFEETA